MEPLRSGYVTSAKGRNDDRTSGSAPDHAEPNLEVGAAHREAPLVEERAEHDAAGVVEMRTHAARPRVVARRLPLGAIQHFRPCQVVAGMVAAPAVARAEPGAVDGAGHG